MDGSRFDAWTRRRFGRAAGAMVGLLGLASWQTAPAKRKKKRKKKPRRRKCEQLRTRCNPKNDRQVCCGPLWCSDVPELGGRHCCSPRFNPCQDNADCCGNLQCGAEGFCDTV